MNFLIPELVSGVQFNKGPYSAEEGDFSTAGASHIRYANVVDRPMVRASAGGEGWGRPGFEIERRFAQSECRWRP